MCEMQPKQGSLDPSCQSLKWDDNRFIHLTHAAGLNERAKFEARWYQQITSDWEACASMTPLELMYNGLLAATLRVDGACSRRILQHHNPGGIPARTWSLQPAHAQMPLADGGTLPPSDTLRRLSSFESIA